MTTGRFALGDHFHRRSPLESALIARLRALPAGPAPEAVFRSDLRAQLVSITARVVAESSTDVAAAMPSAAAKSVLHRPGRSPRTSGRVARPVPARGALASLRRPVIAFASAACVLILMLGLAVWMSSSSLPGDSLYGVKRASENVQLSMAGSDVSKGNTYLDLAARRADEVGKLLSRNSALALAGNGPEAAGSINAHTASLITQTLGSADSDSRNAMQLLGGAAVAQVSADPLSKLPDWLTAQRARLDSIAGRVPAGALRARTQQSLALLDRISARQAALRADLGCPCLAQANADDLGPIPCTPCPSLGSQGTAPGGTPGTTPGAPGSSGASGSATQGSGGRSGQGSSGSGGGIGGALPSGLPTSGIGGGPTGGGGTGGGVSGLPGLPGLPTLSVPVTVPTIPGLPTGGSTSSTHLITPPSVSLGLTSILNSPLPVPVPTPTLSIPGLP